MKQTGRTSRQLTVIVNSLLSKDDLIGIYIVHRSSMIVQVIQMVSHEFGEYVDRSSCDSITFVNGSVLKFKIMDENLKGLHMDFKDSDHYVDELSKDGWDSRGFYETSVMTEVGIEEDRSVATTLLGMQEQIDNLSMNTARLHQKVWALEKANGELKADFFAYKDETATILKSAAMTHEEWVKGYEKWKKAKKEDKDEQWIKLRGEIVGMSIEDWKDQVEKEMHKSVGISEISTLLNHPSGLPSGTALAMLQKYEENTYGVTEVDHVNKSVTLTKIESSICDCHQSKGNNLDIPHANWCKTKEDK